jgi:hypothetical protein
VAERESGRSRDLGTKIGPQPPEEIRVGSHDKASWDGAGRCAAIIVNALDTSPDWRAHWLKDQSGKLAALSEVYRVNGTPRVPAGLWSLL